MTDKVGRNEPCPCGSGKKYKKCCGQSNVVAFSSQAVSKEIDAYSQSLLQRIVERHMTHVSDEQLADNFEAMKEMFKGLYRATVESDTLVEFVDETAPTIDRPMTKQAVQNWKSVQPSLYQILSQGADELILVEDMFTREQLSLSEETFIVEDIKDVPYVLGFAMSWGTYDVMLPVALPVSTPFYNDLMSKGIDRQQFLTEFLHIMDTYFNEDEPMIPTIDFVEADERALEVLRLLFNTLWGNIEIASEEQERIVGIWLAFYSEGRPNFKKPEVMAAVLEYFLTNQELFPSELTSKTFREIANQYSVSPTTISNRFDELDDFLYHKFTNTMQKEAQSPSMATPSAERHLYELNQQLSEQTFESEDELNEYLQNHMNDDYSPQTDEQKAQSIVYDVYEMANEEAKESLIDQALTLDPQNIDAHVLKANIVQSFEEKIDWLHQAINLGPEKLDLAELNRVEMPWAVIEARGWFRAIEQLGDLMEADEDFENAKKWYEYLLNWNPNDNQGIRYQIFPVYIELNELDKAEHISQQYEENTAFWHMNRALCKTIRSKGRLTDEVKYHLNRVQKLNQFIIPLSTDEELSDEFLERMTQTDPEVMEAEEYDWSTGYLWFDYEGTLREFLNRK